jgi:hypothetical protein
LWSGFSCYYQAQQVSQSDAPPVGGFGALFFIKVRRLRLAFVSGVPLTVTLGLFFIIGYFKFSI